MTQTAKQLAEIAERSPGYAVTVIEDDKSYEMTDFRFRRTASGRRNKAVVECLSNGSPAVFNGDEPFNVKD